MSGSYSIKAEFNVAMEARDGTKLYADIYRPDAPGKFPVLLSRTPYDKSAVANRSGTIDVIRAAASGFATVVQDVRGRYKSEGDFYTFVNEIDDGYDTVEANNKLGFSADLREYGIVAQILIECNVGKMKLFTNNPKKIDALKKSDLKVNKRIPIKVESNAHNKSYLDTKAKKLGHLM